MSNLISQLILALSPIYYLGTGIFNIPYISYIGIICKTKIEINYMAISVYIILAIDILMHELMGSVSKDYWILFFSMFPYTIRSLKINRDGLNGIVMATIICLTYYTYELYERMIYMSSEFVTLHNTYADYKFGSISGQDTNFTAIYLYCIFINIILLRNYINKNIYKILLIYSMVLIFLTLSRSVMIGMAITLIWVYRDIFNIKITKIIAILLLIVLIYYIKEDPSFLSKLDIFYESINQSRVFSSTMGIFGNYAVTSEELTGINYTGHTISYMILNQFSIFYTIGLMILFFNYKKNKIYSGIFILMGLSLFPFMFVAHSISQLLLRSKYDDK